MYATARVFLRFLQRDIYTYRHRFMTYVINYALIYPLIYSFFIGHLQGTAYFGNDVLLRSSLLIGHILIVILVFANILNIGLIFDLENQRYIDYQLTLLDPRLIMVERILFSSLFTFLISLPFFPIAKLILGEGFITAHTSWPKTVCMLYACSLLCATYTQCMVCIIPTSRKVRSFWMRFNFVLNTLGGLFIPWYTMNTLSPVLGYVTLLNPLLYITEGLRQTLLAQEHFLSFSTCMGMLLFYSLLFTLASFYYFKKRVDHI